MDKIEKIVDELGLRDYGDFDGNVFIATFENSDEFSNAYSEISDNFDAEEDGEFNDSNSMTVFTSDDIEIIASANYDKDDYVISVGEK